MGGGRILALVVLVVALARVCFAGAWTQSRGGYYARLSGSYLRTEEEFNYRGDRLDLFEEHPGFGDASFRYLGVTVCGEYGHTDRFTFVASLPIKAQRSERVAQIGGGAVRLPEARNTVGLGDLWLSLRTGLATEPVVSVQTGVKSHSATMTNRTTTDLVSVREISTARSACSWADHCTPCQLTSAEASATADAVDA